jgi:FtsP/CotA-like multicopper oxidase with cupredoxin domain
MASGDDRRGGGLSTAGKLGLVAAAIVVLVVAFVIAASGSDDAEKRFDEPPPATTQAGETEDEPTGGEAGPSESADHDDRAQAEPEAEEPTVEVVRVRGGAPVGGVETLEYRRGDRIRLRVTADAPDEVHVHGFDVEKPVGPSAPATFNIEADIEGRFEVELHESGAQIATIEVSPRS